MTSIETRNHEQLLTLARKVEAAASDGDHDRLQMLSAHLYEALRDHIVAERIDLLELPRDEGLLLAHGQQAVLAELAALAKLAVVADAPWPCGCAACAARLIALLDLQATDERLALARLAASL